MPVYSYTALTEQGAKQYGKLAADHPTQLRRELRARGLAPLQIEAEKHSISSQAQRAFKAILPGDHTARAFSRRQLQLFTHQLSLLLEGGLPLEKALNLIVAQKHPPAVAQILAAIHGQLCQGVAFADCLGSYPNDFNVMYRTTVAAGEHTGTLSKVLIYLAHYIELQFTTQQKIRMALFYPSLLAVFSLSVTVFLLIFIVPDLARTFAHSGHALPALTQMVLNLSELTKQYGLIALLLLLGITAIVKRVLKAPITRFKWDGWLLRLPLISGIMIDVELTAFFNTLAMLLQSGVILADSMRVASNIVGNLALKKSIEEATERVCEGTNLSDALADVPLIPAPLIGLISGGEISGELTRILQLAARQQSHDLQQRAAWFLSILEPCIILATGLLVLIIVLAMMMPILTLNQLVK